MKCLIASKGAVVDNTLTVARNETTDPAIGEGWMGWGRGRGVGGVEGKGGAVGESMDGAAQLG